MPVCNEGCQPPCSYGCELRQKGVGIAPSATPSRMNKVPPRKADPAWERGIVTDKRCDGSVMPVFEPGTMDPLHVKQYGDNRHSIDAGLKRLRQPTPT